MQTEAGRIMHRRQCNPTVSITLVSTHQIYQSISSLKHQPNLCCTTTTHCPIRYPMSCI